MSNIPINLAVEDDLSEVVLKQMLIQSQRSFIVGDCLKKRGFGYLKKNITGLNKAAQGMPYLVLTDLDKASCPLEIISTWLKKIIMGFSCNLFKKIGRLKTHKSILLVYTEQWKH